MTAHPSGRPYDHDARSCDDSCDYDTCRLAYRRALGLDRRERANAEDARREDAERAWWRS